jgi:hypothetical protein
MKVHKITHQYQSKRHYVIKYNLIYNMEETYPVHVILRLKGLGFVMACS